MGWGLMLRSSQLEMATSGLDRDFSIMVAGGRELDLLPSGPLPSWDTVLEYCSLWSTLIL